MSFRARNFVSKSRAIKRWPIFKGGSGMTLSPSNYATSIRFSQSVDRIFKALSEISANSKGIGLSVKLPRTLAGAFVLVDDEDSDPD
jgi:hypothetical protein